MRELHAVVIVSQAAVFVCKQLRKTVTDGRDMARGKKFAFLSNYNKGTGSKVVACTVYGVKDCSRYRMSQPITDVIDD